MAILKTPAEIKIMAEAGRRLGEILEKLKNEVKEGLPTNLLDQKAFSLIRAAGAEPAFLGYRPSGSKKAYPATICVSLNDTIVHGLPSEYRLKSGDLVKIDLGLRYKGFFADSATTVAVGKISSLAVKLIKITEEALNLAIKEVIAGNALGSVGFAVQKHVESQNFSVVRALTGHGIGRELHEDPNVYNFGHPGEGEDLEVGMVLALEPMVTSGPPPQGGKIKHLPDDSFVTSDGSLAAHFEHTVAITDHGPLILTKI